MTSRGYRFSTYATWAIRNVIADQERRTSRGRARTLLLYEDTCAASAPGIDAHEIAEELNERGALIGRWLGRLDERERWVLANRYGIGGVPVLTLTEIGRRLGISKARTRQLESRAVAKVRKLAGQENAFARADTAALISRREEHAHE